MIVRKCDLCGSLDEAFGDDSPAHCDRCAIALAAAHRRGVQEARGNAKAALLARIKLLELARMLVDGENRTRELFGRWGCEAAHAVVVASEEESGDGSDAV